MEAYDKVDWHTAAAIAEGGTREDAFTHIGIYLAWLIRHDLHDPRGLPTRDVTATRRGDTTSADLADAIDGTLSGELMNAEGNAFSAARHDAYLREYGRLFPGRSPYLAGDSPGVVARVELLLDDLYARWVADGRPAAAPKVEAPAAGSGAAAAKRAPARPAQAEPGPAGAGATVARPAADEVGNPTPEQMPHVAPELEALVPADLASPAMGSWSVSGSALGSSTVNRALKRLGLRPRDITVVISSGGDGVDGVSVTLYRVRGIDRERLFAEFEDAIYRPGRRWEHRDIGGRTVKWTADRNFTGAYWTLDGLVVHVAGRNPAVIEGVIPRLP